MGVVLSFFTIVLIEVSSAFKNGRREDDKVVTLGGETLRYRHPGETKNYFQGPLTGSLGG
jgi:hypothetical protein